MQTERVSGFSLVEVMIAVAVFAIIILAIGQAAMVGISASNEVKEQTNIILGCQWMMEQCLLYSLDDLQQWYTHPEIAPTFSLRVRGPDTLPEPGGTVVVDKDLDGNGVLDTGSLCRENRTENDLFRVAVYYKGNLILQRVVAKHR